MLKNLTDVQLSNIDLFYFDDASEGNAARATPQCKTFPGDSSYPSQSVWKVLDILSGGALIETVPLGSACYEGEYYDAAKCSFLVDNWNNSETQ